MSSSPAALAARRPTLAYALGGAGVLLLVLGSCWGLYVAPREAYMGDVQRIMYVHVPTAWSAFVALTVAFVSAVAFLLKGRWSADARLEAAMEVGVVLAVLLCIQGALWAKPTWGVFWDWDPRLTTTAVMVFAFAGILALRSFVEDPARRAVWSAVATVIAFVDVPIVYFSVRWWSSLHQLQSTPDTVSRAFQWPLGINALGLLLLTSGMIGVRARLAAMRLVDELGPPLLEPAPKMESRRELLEVAR